MIEKFIRIRNIGKFTEYTASRSGNVSLDRLTLIYAENGRGKTTLAAILRSLQADDPRYIQERRTLGADGEPEVELRASGSTLTYRGDAWQNAEPKPEILIFDPTFVTQNVYSGDVVKHEQKLNLHRFALGEEPVRLANRLDELARLIRDKNAEIQRAEASVREHIVGEMPVREFVNLREAEDVDAKIAAKAMEIESLRAANEIRDKQPLSELILPDIPFDDVVNLLARTLEGVSAEAERRVREHIRRCMDERGETWIEQGVEYIRGDHCPFCGQSLEGVDLIAAYRGYFSQAYADLKREIDEFRQRVQRSLEEDALLRIQQTLNQNESLLEFWRRHVDVSVPDLSFEEVREALTRVRGAVASLFERKASGPLEAVIPDAPFKRARAACHGLQRQIAAYNDAVRRAQGAISRKKSEVASANIAQAQQEFTKLQNAKVRFEEDACAACEAWSRRQREKVNLETEREQRRDELRCAAEAAFERWGEAVNEHLRRFGADFAIVGIAERHYSGVPRVDYRIRINDCDVDLETRDNEPRPCFRNTLSSGDRTTLALAFFLARLEVEESLSGKVVVLDDPLSSLGYQRRLQTRQEIFRIARRAGQVIVLSHDALFLRLLWDGAQQNSVARCALCLQDCGGHSTITAWDVERETEGEYFKHCRALLEYMENGARDDQHRRQLAQDIRSVLEFRLRVGFPGCFAASDSLGQMLGKIRVAKADSPLRDISRAIVSDLADVDKYTVRYHHSEGVRVDRGPVSDAELRRFVERAFTIVRSTRGPALQG